MEASMNERKDARVRGFRPPAKVLAVVVAGMMAVPASASWEDRSGELPGITSMKSAVIWGAAIGGGVVAVLYFLNKNKADARVEVQPPKLNHGDVANGQSSQQQVTITNRSAEPVTVESIGISGKGFSFAVPPAFPTTLESGKAVTLPVNFTPASSGRFSGRVEVRAAVNGGKSKKWTVSLRGEGL
jgi:hypothetical protein